MKKFYVKNGRRYSLASPQPTTQSQMLGDTPTYYTRTPRTVYRYKRATTNDIPSVAPINEALVGLNIGGISYFSSEDVFIDLTKRMAKIATEEDIQAGVKVDENGYPTYIPEGRTLSPILYTFSNAQLGEDKKVKYPDQYVKTGRYVLLYEGSQAVWQRNDKLGDRSNIKGKNAIYIGGFPWLDAVSEQAGRIEFTISHEYSYQSNLYIHSVDPNNPIRNIRIVPLEYEQLSKEQVWTPNFLQRWSGVEVFRYMDMMETNNSPIKTWADTKQLTNATWAGQVPYEALIDLSNRTGKDGWFCIPHQADDDFVYQFAKLLKDKLKTKAYIEYSNEMWNWGFRHTHWAVEQFKALNLPAGNHSENNMFYAHRAKQIFKIFNEVYGDDIKTRIVKVISGQSAWKGAYRAILQYEDVYKEADALSTAPYMNANILPELVPTAENWTVDQMLDDLEFRALPECTKWMKENKEVADEFGLPLLAYEGGQHISLGRGVENNIKLEALMLEANRHPRMENIYNQYFNAWTQAGGKLFMNFSSMSKWTKWGAWGIFESPYQPLESSPKYLGWAKWANAQGKNMAFV